MTTTHRAKIIDGRALATQAKSALADRVRSLDRAGRSVRLDAILTRRGGPSEIYARNQTTACEELGIQHVLHDVAADASYADIVGRVLLLNDDERVSAMMVHLPLPDGVDTEQVQSLIDSKKDVEGVNPSNIGNVVYGRRSLVPCTALAVMRMIESTGIDLPGARCVVVGASNIVGKPVAILLMRAEATVVSTNIHTEDQARYTQEADVIVTAAGVPGLITGDMVKPGAVVIDVGINRVTDGEGRSHTVGDVAFDEVCEIAGWVSPVPGGVGPMTVAMLLSNTIDAAERA